MTDESENNPIIQDVEEWISDTAKEMAKDTMDSVIAISEELTTDAALNVATHYLCFYLSGLLTLALSLESSAAKTKQQKYEVTTHNFLAMKKEVQEKVAVAFASAISQFTKQPIEYYCEIKPLPEVTEIQ